MADSKDELIIKIGADFKQLKAELDKAGGSVKGFSEKGKKSLEAIVQKSKELDKDTTFNTLKTELEKAGGDYEKLSKKGIAALRKLNSTTKTSTKKSSDSVAKLDKEVESSTKGVSKSFKDLDKDVKKSAKSIEQSTEKIGFSFKNLSSKAGAVKLAVGAATAVVGLYVNRAAESAIETERWAMRLGMSASELSKLSNVAQLGGANLDDLTDTMKEVAIKAGEAAEGNEGYRKTFQTLGIDARTFAQLPMEQQFRALADAVSTTDVEAQQLIRAVDDLASDAGVRMIETLKKGSKGIDEMGKSAAVTAASLSDFDFEQIKKAKAEMDRLRLSIDALANLMLVKFSGAITAVADAAEKMAGKMKTKPISDWTKASKEAAKVREELKDKQEEFGGFWAKKTEAQKDELKRLDEMKLLADDILELERQKAELMTNGKSIAALQGEIDKKKELKNATANPLESVSISGKQGREEALNSLLGSDISDSAPDNFMVPSNFMGGDMNEREALGEERKEFLEKQFEDQLERNREFMLQYGEEQIRFNREEYDREKEKMLKLQLLYNSGYRGRLQMAEGFFDDIASMSKSKNSNLFKIAKTASIAMGMVNAYAGASQTLADPSLPFYAKIAAVTSVLAKGFAMVSSLKSINESGGGGGATAGGGGATATAEAPAQIMETNVTFSGSGDVSQDQFRGFVAGLNDALDDGMTIGRITA